jgi:hypothetical protein
VFCEHKPVNFFGYCFIRIAIGAVSAKRSHSLIEFRIRKTRQEGVGAQCRLPNKASQSGATISLMISWCIAMKPVAAKCALISSAEGRSRTRTRAAGTMKLPAINLSRSSSLACSASRRMWIAVPVAVWFQNQSPSWRLAGLAAPAVASELSR